MSNSATSRGSDRIMSYCLGICKGHMLHMYRPKFGARLYIQKCLSFCPPGWSLYGATSCPGGLCPGGLCPGGSLSGGSLSREVSVQGGLCLGVSVQGSLSRGVSVGRPPGIRKAGSTHPTGMLPCLQLKYLAIARI